MKTQILTSERAAFPSASLVQVKCQKLENSSENLNELIQLRLSITSSYGKWMCAKQLKSEPSLMFCLFVGSTNNSTVNAFDGFWEKSECATLGFTFSSLNLAAERQHTGMLRQKNTERYFFIQNKQNSIYYLCDLENIP